jgi:O-antigen ligase
MGFLYVYLIALFIAPQLWWQPLTGWQVDYLIYPFWTLWVILTGRIARIKLGAADLFFVCLIAWITLSLVANGTGWRFWNIVLLRYFKWFWLYMLVRCTVSNDAELRRAAAFLTLLILVLVVEGISHKHSEDGLNWAGQPLGWVDVSVLEAGGTGRIRWVGVFDGIGVFAVAFNIGLPFVLQYATGPYAAPVKLLNRLALPFLLLAIYYTASRGGFLTTLAIIFLTIAVRYRISIKAIGIAAALVTVVFGLAPAHLTQTSDSQRSAQARVDVWAQGLMMLKASPVVGVGRGNYVTHTRTIIAHNSAIEIAAETGVVGFFLWCSLILTCLRHAWLRHAASTGPPQERSMLVALMLAVVGYLTASMFVTLEYETFYTLLALCVGAGATAARPYGKREFLGVCALVVAFVVFVRIFVGLYF